MPQNRTMSAPKPDPTREPSTDAPIELSATLRSLAADYKERPAQVGEILDTLGPRGSALLVVMCALPFSTPISLPGISTPFGLVILLLAARYFAGKPPWLPQRLRRVVIPPAFFGKILSASSRFVGFLERWLKPRLSFLANAEWKLRLHTAVVILSAVLLMLPLPPVPPFTNTLPALVAVVMTLSTLKRDGVGILAGYALFAFTIGYFIFWGAVIVEAFQRYGGKLLSLFGAGD